jgi:hypothetical protein
VRKLWKRQFVYRKELIVGVYSDLRVIQRGIQYLYVSRKGKGILKAGSDAQK